MLLGRTVVEGGSVIIRVAFKDELGNSYIPVEVFYSLYAKHAGEDTWEVVNRKQRVEVPAASALDVVLQGDDLALLGGCTSNRAVLVEWSYLKGEESILCRERIDFEISGLFTVVNPIEGYVGPRSGDEMAATLDPSSPYRGLNVLQYSDLAPGAWVGSTSQFAGVRNLSRNDGTYFVADE